MRARLLLIGSVVTVASACGHSAQRLVHYRAVIERVESSDVFPVQYYSPAAEPVTVTRVRLRVVLAGARRPGSSVVVVATGLHGADELGRPSETVAFSYSGPLPMEGEVRFEALRDYRVEPAATAR